MTKEVKITVLMSAYNAEAFIAEAIESVLEQSFPHFEFIIVNDGSTDGTEGIIRSFNDPRIRLISQENGGIAAALNAGLALARAPLVARFDADDICYPQRLERQYRFMEAHPQVLLLGSAADYTDREGNYIFTQPAPEIDAETLHQWIYRRCPFIHSSVCYRAEAVRQCGGYDLASSGFEDHLLWLKMLRSGPAANLPQALIRVRLSPESFTIDERWQHPLFRRLKSTVLKRGHLLPEEGAQLAALMKRANRQPIKLGAYHALLGKKYLWNNHRPAEARRHFLRSWKEKRRPAMLLLWLVSFFPFALVRFAYEQRRTGAFPLLKPHRP